MDENQPVQEKDKNRHTRKQRNEKEEMDKENTVNIQQKINKYIQNVKKTM